MQRTMTKDHHPCLELIDCRHYTRDMRSASIVCRNVRPLTSVAMPLSSISIPSITSQSQGRCSHNHNHGSCTCAVRINSVMVMVRGMATDKAGGADLKKRMDLGRAQAAERAERQKESQSKV